MQLHSVCENALSEALKALVLKGHGMAWIPESLIADELASGQLAILQEPFASVELSIKLYRLGKPANTACEAFGSTYRPDDSCLLGKLCRIVTTAKQNSIGADLPLLPILPGND
ncbi:LysR substrate-binding domain-containing protein [Aliamphritea spongicola]